MLSINFDVDREWWVSGAVFDRMYDASIGHGVMPPDLIAWRHIAEANGGLDVRLESPSDAERFKNALRDTARRELLAVDDIAANEGYRIALRKLLDLLACPDVE